MGRRVLVYAVVYGSIGVAIGVMLALYTKDVEVPKQIVLKVNSNGSSHKGTAGVDQPTEPTTIPEEVN